MKVAFWASLAFWLLLLTGCPQEPVNAVTAYEWHGQTAPATSIQIEQNAPEAVRLRCPQSGHIDACATVGGPVCVIHFAKTWNSDWKLLEHELRHCNGLNHS